MKAIREFRSYRSAAAFDPETGRFGEQREPHPFSASPGAPPTEQGAAPLRPARHTTLAQPVPPQKKPPPRIPPKSIGTAASNPPPDP